MNKPLIHLGPSDSGKYHPGLLNTHTLIIADSTSMLEIKSESEIVELIGLVNQLGGQWNGSNSNMNGSISSSDRKANGFKLDDKLNV